MGILPGEVFVEFGLDIKKRSPFEETHVVTMAGGDLPGYCVTREAMAIGGYEAGNSLLDPVSGQILVDNAIRLLGSVRPETES